MTAGSEIDREDAARFVARHPQAWLVEIVAVQGSAPRAAGTRLLVAADAVAGTVGGGHLEFEAIRLAREALATGSAPFTREWALGPSLGQCCGGRVTLRFASLGAGALEGWPTQAARFHAAVFGAGHVGHALARLLATLPCRVTLVDERPEAFDRELPRPVRALSTDDACAEMPRMPAGTHVLVMTHSHDLDLRLCEAALARPDLPFVGLIGSVTKRARFEHRLRGRGHDDASLARWHCPVGLPGIEGKEPAVIAVAVAAQLLACTRTG